ncbi:MAG: hypothetical protein EXR79_14745 [Myxococcales bacterium]|nr:hypothetical protein [Myxococcales bacterium]
MTGNRADAEFEAEMAKQGVVPIAVPPLHSKAPPPARPGRAPAPVEAPNAVRSSLVPPAAAIWQKQLNARDALVSAEIERLRREVERLVREVAHAKAETDASVAIAAELDARREEAESDVAAAEAQRNAAWLERDNFDHERRVVNQQSATLREELHSLTVRLAAADKTELLPRRGIEDPFEAARILTVVLERLGPKALPALLAPDSEPLRGLLDRLALVCDDARCRPASRDALVFHVDKPRCEVCGGSDVQRAFLRLVQAVQATRHDRVTIVGGSPSYRETLRNLARDHGAGLQFDVVGSERPDEAKRAKSARGLVVLWGATEIDHSATGHWKGAGDQQLQIPHRGIAGLLTRISEALEWRQTVAR